MQLIPLLISILLFVSSKLKPLQPSFGNLTKFLISASQPITHLENKVSQQKLFIASLPSMQYQNLLLQAENSNLKTTNLLLKNQLTLNSFKEPSWNTVPVRIIKMGQTITATTNQTDQIQPGMPLVYSTNLVGIVQDISGPIINILPLTSLDITFPTQVSPNIKGDYVFQDQTPQMINIQNQTVPNPGDTMFTLPTEQIPEGLIVGKTKQIITQPSNPIQRVEIILTSSTLQTNSTHIIIKP